MRPVRFFVSRACGAAVHHSTCGATALRGARGTPMSQPAGSSNERCEGARMERRNEDHEPIGLTDRRQTMRKFNGLVAAVLAVVAVAQAAVAGPWGGTQTGVHRVNAWSEDAFNVSFRGGEYASVTVIGDHDTDLDLYVYDESGRMIASDDDDTDVCITRFYVPRGGSYRIEVDNRGSVWNEYRITAR